jgi:hypothetical protein
MEFVIRILVEIYTSIYDYSGLYDLLGNIVTGILIIYSILCAIFLTLGIIIKMWNVLFKKRR